MSRKNQLENCQNRMGVFDTSEATALTREEMEKLKVAGAGSEIKAKLQACGATGGEVCAAIIIAVEGAKVKGSKWTIVGNLGQVDVSTHRLKGERGVVVTVDLSDMTKFPFPGATDPRNGANRSEWVGGHSLATKMITQDETIQDKHAMSQHDYMAEGDFSLRATVVPIWGQAGQNQQDNRGNGHHEARGRRSGFQKVGHVSTYTGKPQESKGNN